jgi:hypothetical protein
MSVMRFTASFFVALPLFALISIGRAAPSENPTVADATVTKIVLRTRAGHTFTILRPIETEPSGLPAIPMLARRSDLFAPSAALARSGPLENNVDFAGSARKAAKTSIASGPLRQFSGLSLLVRSLVPDDNMRALHISDAEDSKRVAPENKNVSVTAYLYATKRERDDNDYHIILGSTPSARSTTKFLNSEVAGLANNPYRVRLAAARTKFENLYAQSQQKPPGTKYEFFQPAMKVRVKGSLFFDLNHQAGEASAGNYTPQTAWEIHPITDIVFDP